MVARWIRVAALAALMLGAAGARAEYLPKGSPRAAGARNIVLIYNGGPYHRDWQLNDFVPLMAHTTRSGQVEALMFDTMLMLPLWARSGRGYTSGFGTGPSNKVDWDDYLNNTLFGGQYQVSKMDGAAAYTGAALVAPGTRWKLIFTIPYPDPAQHAWGSLTAGGRVLDFANLNDRIDAVRWYVGELTRRFAAGGYSHLDWVGLYWLNEGISTSDATLLTWVSAITHAGGQKLFWIPYYHATGWSSWSSRGIDAAIYQPNYFFTLSVPLSRLHDTAVGAMQYGMGVELELDDRAISDPAYRSRYYDYLNAGRTEGFQTGALTAWYMGGDTLVKAQASTNATIRALYDDTYTFIYANGKPGDVTANGIVDSRDARALLRIAGGLAYTDQSTFATVCDVEPNRRADVADAVKLLRHLSGLQASLP